MHKSLHDDLYNIRKRRVTNHKHVKSSRNASYNNSQCNDYNISSPLSSSLSYASTPTTSDTNSTISDSVSTYSNIIRSPISNTSYNSDNYKVTNVRVTPSNVHNEIRIVEARVLEIANVINNMDIDVDQVERSMLKKLLNNITQK